jgi:hypothetical protein
MLVMRLRRVKKLQYLSLTVLKNFKDIALLLKDLILSPEYMGTAKAIKVS